MVVKCGVLVAALALAVACKKDKDKGGDGDSPEGKKPGTGESPTPGIKTDRGVDAAKKVVKIGMLNDESGPAAAIGKPYAAGKRLLAKRVNAGGSGVLPDGWTIKLVEKDHAYNPQQSVQSFNAIKNDVLFIGHSFGTPNTKPLWPLLKRDKIVAFPASLQSEMAEQESTPPLGPSYEVEAMRALDWMIDNAGGADKIKAAIVYQNDDYGKDGLKGFKAAAAKHKVEIVSEQTVAAGQKDVTAAISALKSAGATHVLLTVLPSSSGPVLGTALKLDYKPVWVGNTPSWIDAFFNPKVIPHLVFANFHMVTGFTFWGEEGDGMTEFVALWDKHGGDLGVSKDWYILLSYVQGLTQLEALKKAIESGDVTRAGYAKALRSIEGFTAGGLAQPINLVKFPYATSDKTRVLKPDFDKGTWAEIAPYAAPK